MFRWLYLSHRVSVACMVSQITASSMELFFLVVPSTSMPAGHAGEMRGILCKFSILRTIDN